MRDGARIALPERLDRRGLLQLMAALADRDGPVLLVGACSGLDLGADPSDDVAWQALREVLRALHEGPPSAAWVTGPVQGGGLGLVCAADQVFAAPEATFALPEALFGLIPGAVAPAIRGRIGIGGLRRLAVRATAVGAEEAIQLGLADGPATHEGTVVRHLARLDPGAVRALRALLQPAYLADVDAGIAASRALLPDAEARLRRWAAGETPWSK